MVVCLERGADLHTAQLLPLPLTVSCFSKIQIGFTFLVPAHPGSPGQRAVKRVSLSVGVTSSATICLHLFAPLVYTSTPCRTCVLKTTNSPPDHSSGIFSLSVAGAGSVVVRRWWRFTGSRWPAVCCLSMRPATSCSLCRASSLHSAPPPPTSPPSSSVAFQRNTTYPVLPRDTMLARYMPYRPVSVLWCYYNFCPPPQQTFATGASPPLNL